MLATVLTATTIGIQGEIIHVEVDVANRGFPSFTLAGLPGKAVDEAKDRVRTAIVNTGFDMPEARITVNLAPADIPKNGTSFDLPIALGILAASGVIPKEKLQNILCIGELSLEGVLREVPGMIAYAILARKKQIQEIFIPFNNTAEMQAMEGITVYACKNLLEVVEHLTEKSKLKPTVLDKSSIQSTPHYTYDFADIKGQQLAKRALEIAAAGFHNIHLKGPPGAGKTLLSRSFPSILPPLDSNELLEVSQIYSVMGLLKNRPFMTERPYRAPHHTISAYGLIGGGAPPKPGEITLAHRGVLFLDEFPEFPRNVLESLRQPLEDGTATISRISGSVEYPCRFLLLTASNPCPCGYMGHPKKVCTCSAAAIDAYQKRISGPLLDRIDIHLDIPAIEHEELITSSKAESSENIRKRIIQARKRQKIRLANSNSKTNGEMTSAEVKIHCEVSKESATLLKLAVERYSLSARAYFKILKVARTIADLDSSESINSNHVSESLQFRIIEK